MKPNGFEFTSPMTSKENQSYESTASRGRICTHRKQRAELIDLCRRSDLAFSHIGQEMRHRTITYNSGALWRFRGVYATHESAL